MLTGTGAGRGSGRRPKRPRDEPGLERGLVHAPAAEEAGALDDVERAELGRDDVDDAEPGRADVRARHVHREGGHAARAEPSADRLDQLEDVVALERRRRRACRRRSARGVEEGRPCRALRGRRRTSCGRRTSRSRRPAGRAARAARASGRAPSAGRRTPRRAPSATRRRRSAPPRRRRRAPRAAPEARARRRAPPARRGRRSGRRRSSGAPTGRSSAGRARAISSSLPPVEQRQREPVVPGEHERVPLDELEQPGERRLLERRAAGEAAARGVADARLAAGASAARACRRAARAGAPALRSGSEKPSTQLSTVSRRNGRNGKPGVACCAAEKSAKRSGSTAPGELGRAADDEPARGTYEAA